MRPKTICPIFAVNEPSFFENIEKIDESECDLIEIRLDTLMEMDSQNWKKVFHKAVESVSKPVIATIRTSQEGGDVKLSPKTYNESIQWLLSFPEILVDVELPYAPHIESFDMYRDRIILSKHFFDHTPQELSCIWDTMEAYHPHIQKLACMPLCEDDTARLLISCYNHKTSSSKIAISMSRLGSVSRIAGYVFGSAYTFTSLVETSAPGQMSLEKMSEIMDILV